MKKLLLLIVILFVIVTMMPYVAGIAEDIVATAILTNE